MPPFLRLPAVLFCLILTAAAPASAQFLNNSTVYDEPLRQLLQQDQMLAWQMRQQEQLIIQQNMNDPRVQAAYRQYRVQGGHLPIQDFAYLYGATGGFSPQGIQQFNQTTRDITRQQQIAHIGLVQAQQDRAAAQQEHAEGFGRIMDESGHMLGGNSTYIHPGSGQPVVLPHISPGVIHRDQTGQLYRMDNLGTYYVQAPNGLWYPMQSHH